MDFFGWNSFAFNMLDFNEELIHREQNAVLNGPQ